MLRQVSYSAAPESHRYTIFAFVFLMYALSYCDRAALSIALPSLSGEFHLTATEQGWLASSFLWSYFLLNLPSGILLDFKGPRIVGCIAVGLWSFAMLLSAGVHNIYQFLLTRVLLGVGEAPTFPLGGWTVRNWALIGERGTVTTILNAGMHVGVAAGTIGGALLLTIFGWRVEFAVLGVTGIVWVVAWWMIYPRRPCEVAPLRTILTLAQVGRLFRSSSFIAVLAAMCTGNFCNFLLLSWVPVYLIRLLHISVINAGMMTALCYVSAALLAVVCGRAAEVLTLRLDTLRSPRRLVVGCFLTSAALCLASLPMLHGTIVIAFLGLAIASLNAASGANIALLVDLLEDGTRVGSVSGVIFTLSNLIGIFAPVLAGYILHATGTFNAAWYAGACGLLVGAAMAIWMTGERISVHQPRI